MREAESIAFLLTKKFWHSPNPNFERGKSKQDINNVIKLEGKNLLTAKNTKCTFLPEAFCMQVVKFAKRGIKFSSLDKIPHFKENLEKSLVKYAVQFSNLFNSFSPQPSLLFPGKEQSVKVPSNGTGHHACIATTQHEHKMAART